MIELLKYLGGGVVLENSTFHSSNVCDIVYRNHLKCSYGDLIVQTVCIDFVLSCALRDSI